MDLCPRIRPFRMQYHHQSLISSLRVHPDISVMSPSTSDRHTQCHRRRRRILRTNRSHSNLRKVNILLQAIDRAGKAVDYFALDLCLSELQRTLGAFPTGTYRHVSCHGLLGTYEDGLEWLKKPDNIHRPKFILSMGSSIGNFSRADAAEFLRKFAGVLGPQGSLIIGLDGCKDKDKVYHAYNDKLGVTHKFLLNGLLHANTIIGHEVFNLADWTVVGEYDEEAGRHQAFYVPNRDVHFKNITMKAGEKIKVEESYKYSPQESSDLWKNAGVIKRASFGSSEYRKLFFFYLGVVKISFVTP